MTSFCLTTLSSGFGNFFANLASTNARDAAEWQKMTGGANGVTGYIHAAQDLFSRESVKKSLALGLLTHVAAPLGSALFARTPLVAGLALVGAPLAIGLGVGYELYGTIAPGFSVGRAASATTLGMTLLHAVLASRGLRSLPHLAVGTAAIGALVQGVNGLVDGRDGVDASVSGLFAGLALMASTVVAAAVANPLLQVGIGLALDYLFTKAEYKYRSGVGLEASNYFEFMAQGVGAGALGAVGHGVLGKMIPSATPYSAAALATHPRIAAQLRFMAMQARAQARQGQETEGVFYVSPHSDRVEIVMGHDPHLLGGHADMRTPIMAADDAKGNGSVAEMGLLFDTVPTLVQNKMQALGLKYGGHFHLTSGDPIPSTQDLRGLIERYRNQGISHSVILKPNARGALGESCELAISGDSQNPWITARFSDSTNAAYAQAFRENLQAARQATRVPRERVESKQATILTALPRHLRMQFEEEAEICAAASTIASCPPSIRLIPANRPLLVGRAPSADYRIIGVDDRLGHMISNNHCFIRYDLGTGKYWIIDNQSRNGTYVDQIQIPPVKNKGSTCNADEWTPFFPTDDGSIRLGSSECGFELIPYLREQLLIRGPMLHQRELEPLLSATYRRYQLTPLTVEGRSYTDCSDQIEKIFATARPELEIMMGQGPTSGPNKIKHSGHWLRKDTTGKIWIRANKPHLFWIINYDGTTPIPKGEPHCLQPGEGLVLFYRDQSGYEHIRLLYEESLIKRDARAPSPPIRAVEEPTETTEKKPVH